MKIFDDLLNNDRWYIVCVSVSYNNTNTICSFIDSFICTGVIHKLVIGPSLSGSILTSSEHHCALHAIVFVVHCSFLAVKHLYVIG